MLGIVALTVFALLRRFRPAQESVGLPEQQRVQDALDDEHEDRSLGDTLRDYLAVPSVIMRWMFPAIIMLSAYLFLRGHDLPGGGFAAGIALAIAFLLQYLGTNVREVEDRLRILPVRWIGPRPPRRGRRPASGAWLFGYPFLTSHARYLELPLIGKVPVATALLFDLGVFLLVVGATVLILVAIAHQSLRSSRAPTRDAPRRRRRRRGGRLMEAVLALAIGVLVGSGVWLLLRPRTFQVIIGLALLSYGVNLFIFAMGRPRVGAAPILDKGGARRSRAPTPTRCRRRWC